LNFTAICLFFLDYNANIRRIAEGVRRTRTVCPVLSFNGKNGSRIFDTEFVTQKYTNPDFTNMAVVLVQKPDAISMSGNLKELILQSSKSVDVTLYVGGTLILSETYYPGNGNLIHVDFTEVVETYLSFKLPSSDVFVQAELARMFNFNCTADSVVTTGSFTAIRSGKLHLNEAASQFLTENFLTWQPSDKPVTYYSPEYLTYYATQACAIKVRAYFEDGSNSVVTLVSPTEGSCYTLNMQYGVISGKFSGRHPMYYDVWVENTSGARLSYVQRYRASEKQSEDECWYLFENSLGGLDCVRAYGSIKDTPEYTYNIANMGDTSEEYRVDCQRLHVRNTGYLSPQESRWLQDLFVSRQKYVYTISGIYKIVFTGGDGNSDSANLPDSYSFTYRYADDRPFLDIQRRTDLPANLVIPVPTGDTFFLPPRLAEFPKPALTVDLLFPVQQPHTEIFGTVTLGGLHDSIKNSIVKDLDGIDMHPVGAGGGGSDIYLVKEFDLTLPTDENAFSSLRALKEIKDNNQFLLDNFDIRYLRKDMPDVAGFDITFEQDIILSGEKSSIYSDRDADSFKHENGFRIFADGTAWVKDLKVKHDSMFAGSLSSPTFASGFPNGTGFMIAPYKVTNAAGVEETKYKLEIDSISVRNELKVYTFVVSQLLGENDNRIFAGMMEVDHYDPETGRIYLDTDGGRLYNPFREGDILMVQQFQGDPTLENDYQMVKSYELKVVEVAVGDLSDGENRLDWLRFTNFVGNLSDIAKRDTLCRVDNPDNSTRSGIMKITTVDEFGTPYMDVIRGMKTDPENCVKVRIGNMNGLVTPYFGRLDGDGAYVENLYARGQFMLDTGENVKTKFEIVEGRLSSEMSSVRYELSEKDNCLTNASFSADTVGWVLGNDVSLFTVKERFMAVNDSFYAEKDKVTGIVEVSSRKALYIKNSGVKQLNSYLKNKPDGQLEMPDGTKVWPTYYVSFMYMVKTAGTLTSGFSGQGLYVSKPLAITDTFVQEEFSGKWNGTGDFILNYTGEIYIYNVQMSTHPVEDLRLEMSTLFLQTDEKIGMYAQKIDTLNGTVTDMGAELDNTTSTLSLYVDKTDSINQTVTSLGLKLDGVDESLTLYAKKTDVSGLKTEMEAAIKVNADNINLKVSKDSIISSINQTAETIKINASRLNLNGFVTFSMFDLSTQNTIKNKVNSGDLGSMAWKDGVSSDDLSWALSQEISNKVNLTTLNNTLLGYTKSGSITKEDLAKALQAELTGKLTGSASVGANKLASVIINGQTLIAGGYIQADLINVKDLVVGSTLSIGAFSLNSYKGLNWTGSDYFGNTSFRLTVGGGYTYNTGTSCKTMVGAWSNSADTHACISGICNTFGVAIYGSTDGWGSNFPPDGSKYAGFFSGSVFATGQMRCSGFSIYKSSDMYRYHYPGVSFNPADFDLDNVRLRVMGGIIVGVTDDNGNILLGS
jgi:hypothetical protein